MHHFDGGGFCVVPIDGVPCLGQRFDRERHVQQYKGPPKQGMGADIASHRFTMTTMNGLPLRYAVLADFDAYRRCVIGRHTSLERCQADLEDPTFGQKWVEDLTDPA